MLIWRSIQIAIISKIVKKIPKGPKLFFISGVITFGPALIDSVKSGVIEMSCAIDFIRNIPTKITKPMRYLDFVLVYIFTYILIRPIRRQISTVKMIIDIEKPEII